MLNGLDLFSGIGGLTLALSSWVRPVAYCENDRYAQGVLLSRMRDGSLPVSPIWDDVRSLTPEALGRCRIDIIVGGFPCQDISIAGNGECLEGKRSGLVFEVFRLIRELRPTFVFLENVSAIRTRGGERVGKELAALGYDCRWDTLSAYDMGAPHKRERWFLLAHTNDIGRRQLSSIFKKDGQKNRPKISRQNQSNKFIDATWWKTEPDIPRMANGVPYQLDRHRALGNAVVPQQAREAFKRLMGL